jgi:hypothetical protein
MDIQSIIDIPQSVQEAAGLTPGELLRVKVASLDDNGRALVELGRWRVSADIRFPVAAGDELLVRVAEAGNRLSLQLIQRSPPEAFSATTAAVEPVRVAPQPLHDLLHRVQQLLAGSGRSAAAQVPAANPQPALEALGRCLAPIEPEAEPGVLSRALARRIEESGLFLESRLARASGAPAAPTSAGAILAADLKARLLFVKAFAETAEGAALLSQNREFAALMRAAGAVLSEIRSAQEQLVRQAAASEPFYMIHVALPMADGLTDAALKIAYRTRRRAGTPEGHRASLLLALDRLGAVRADLLLLERSLNVAVFVSDTAARDWVERHVHEVRDALAVLFENVGVQVSVSHARIARFATEDDRPAGQGQVDVRV